MTTETAERCAAEDRNKRALFELDLQWGSRKIDLAKLRHILEGEPDHEH